MNSKDTQMNSKDTQMNSKDTQIMNSNVVKCYSRGYLRGYLFDNHSEDERHIDKENIAKNKMAAILDSSKIKYAFVQRRTVDLGLISMTTRISVLFIILLFCFIILNTFLKGLPFVQI